MKTIFFTVVSLYAVRARAQQAAFVWGFNNWTTTVLPQCQPLDIFTDGTKGTVKPTPPFYLIAYEQGGVPSVENVGSQEGSLTWTVNHAAGKTLVMGMVDANGNSGGILQQLYTIAGTTGANASCIPNRSAAFTVSTNATLSTLATCDSVKLSMSGGKKPYTVTVAEANTAFSFNSSMGSNDDTFTWVNNLSPGGQVILAVSDSNDAYGDASTIITLSGTSDTRCSQQSRSSNSASPNSTDTSSGGGSSKTSTIVGVIGAIVVVGILGLIGWFFLVQRKKKHQRPEKGWAIDRDHHNASPEHSDAGGNHPATDSEVTPYYLPARTYPSTLDTQSVGMMNNRTSGDRSGRSMLGEEMLSAEGNRESSYFGTESGYGGYNEYDTSHAPSTPTSSQPFSSSNTTSSHDPFRTPTPTPGGSPFASKLARYRDSPPGPPQHLHPFHPSSSQPVTFPPAPNSQYGSIRSQGTSGTGLFRPTNPDYGADDTSTVWSRDTKTGFVGPPGMEQRLSSGEVSGDGHTRVYQHQDAGEPPLEEIPPAYPGPGQRAGGGGSASGSSAPRRIDGDSRS